MAELLLFKDASANMAEPSAVPALGTIATIAAALLVDGETFTIYDGLQPWTFEFDTIGDGKSNQATPIQGQGNFLVNVAGETADQVRDSIIAAINATGEIGITASVGGAASVLLTNKRPGPRGNHSANTDTVANAGFVMSAMSGGLLTGFPTADFRAFKEWIVAINSAAGSGILSVRVRMWGFREFAWVNGNGNFTWRGWVPMPLVQGTVVTDVNRGYLNAGGAIGEDGTDVVRFAESISNMAAYERVYAQLTDIAGITPVFTAIMYADSTWQHR